MADANTKAPPTPAPANDVHETQNSPHPRRAQLVAALVALIVADLDRHPRLRAG